MILAILAGYLVAVLAVGVVANRLFRGTGEDWFVASRTIGPFVLLMSLFGTHMTAFSLLGASGEAYHRGIGVFALMASASALVVPAVFYFLAPRVWELGRRNGYLTQVELVQDRWGSRGLGILLFASMVALLVPYLLIGIKGGGLTVAQISGGQVPAWAGSLVLCAVVFAYVSAGGIRGTAFANTFQTLVFMVLGTLTLVLIVHRSGGLGSMMERIAATAPELLAREGKIRPLELLTYTCIPLSVGMFPHMFMHWLTARDVRSFRLPIAAYPLCVAAVWVPSVLLGLLGAVEFPGLEGPAANSVLIRMIALYAPGALGGLLAAGVFAAVMSSLDSQVLSLSSLFTRDIVGRSAAGSSGAGSSGVADPASDRRQILVGRLFVLGILGLTLALSLVVDRSIFKLGVWSFSGFAALLPVGVAALYWKRATKAGAIASILVAVALWIAFFARAWGTPGYTVGGTGVMPVAVLLGASALTLVLVSLVTRPPGADRRPGFSPVGGSR